MDEFIEYLNNKNIDELYELTLDYARDGKLDKIKILLTHPDLRQHVDILHEDNIILMCACTSGNLDLVKYLLTSPELKVHSDINDQKDFALSCASESGSIEMVEYLVSSPELKKHSKIPFINDSPSNPIIFSSKFKRFDMVDYLVSISEDKDNEVPRYILNALSTASLSGEVDTIEFLLKFPASKSFQKNDKDIMYTAITRVVQSAFLGSEVKVIQFVFDSPELSKYVDLHQGGEHLFKSLLVKSRLNNNFDMMQYLVLDLNIEKTEVIKKILQDYPSNEVERMFTLRDLHKDLKKELSSNVVNEKKIKL